MNFLITLNNERGDCCNCNLSYESEHGQTCCVLTHDRVKNSTCQLVEIIPSPLVWVKQKNSDLFLRAFVPFGYYTVFKKENWGGHSVFSSFEEILDDTNGLTLEQAKKYCQDHYNKVFNEMIK